MCVCVCVCGVVLCWGARSDEKKVNKYQRRVIGNEKGIYFKGRRQIQFVSKTQTHKRFNIRLFVRTKHNIRFFGVIPFVKLQNDT